METNADRRGDPLRLWPDAKSAVVFGQSYAPPSNPLNALDRRSNAAVSVYAKGRDYHDVLKKKIKSLARSFSETSGCRSKSLSSIPAPLMEKPLAAKAGLGWQGKHTILVSREHGNWLFLGAMLTTAELEPDAEMQDHCGSCRRCPRHLPDQRFPSALSARRTTLHRLPHDRAQRPYRPPSSASPLETACSVATTAPRSARGTSSPVQLRK